MQAALVLVTDWFDVHSRKIVFVVEAHPPAKRRGEGWGNPILGICERVPSPPIPFWKFMKAWASPPRRQLESPQRKYLS